MTVLERLWAVVQPVEIDGEWVDLIAPPDDLAYLMQHRWITSPIADLIQRVKTASAAFSLRHMYKRIQTDVKTAITLSTPEMAWFRNVPREASGKENVIPLRVVGWGKL